MAAGTAVIAFTCPKVVNTPPQTGASKEEEGAAGVVTSQPEPHGPHTPPTYALTRTR